MKELNLEEIKIREYEILKNFKNICNENQLRYYLAYGTLLGAVRHKGFIPWDDDIDVMMPREDFHKLEQILQHKSDKQYAFCTYRTNKNYNAPLAKMMDMDTVLVQKYNQVEKSPMGVYIDIFVLDGIPEENNKAEMLFTEAEKMRFFWGLSVRKVKSKSRNLIVAIGKTVLSIPFRIVGGRYYSKKLNEVSSKYSYEDEKYAGVVCFGEGLKKEKLLKTDIEPGIELEFEGEQYMAPKNWEKYLENVYGDYMKLPPEEERVSKHDVKVFMKEKGR